MNHPLWIVIAYSLYFGGMIASLIYYSIPAMVGKDLRYDEDYARQQRGPEYKLDVPRARRRSVVIPQYALPLGLMAFTATTAIFLSDDWLGTWVMLGTLWALFAPLRRLWLLAVSIRLDKVLFRTGVNNRRYIDTDSALELTKRYYARGLRPSQEHVETVEQINKGRLFVGDLKFLNWPVMFVRAIFRAIWRPLWKLLTNLPLRIFFFALVELTVSIITFPFYAVIWTHYTSFNVDKNVRDGIESPYWARGHEPLSRPVPPRGEDPTLLMP